MSWHHIDCPHCGHQTTVSINDNIIDSLTNKICSKYHKPYTTQAVYGKVEVKRK